MTASLRTNHIKKKTTVSDKKPNVEELLNIIQQILEDGKAADILPITLKGKTYLSECHRNKLNKFWSEFRAWMTLAISLAAFIRTFL